MSRPPVPNRCLALLSFLFCSLAHASSATPSLPAATPRWIRAQLSEGRAFTCVGSTKVDADSVLGFARIAIQVEIDTRYGRTQVRVTESIRGRSSQRLVRETNQDIDAYFLNSSPSRMELRSTAQVGAFLSLQSDQWSLGTRLESQTGAPALPPGIQAPPSRHESIQPKFEGKLNTKVGDHSIENLELKCRFGS